MHTNNINKYTFFLPDTSGGVNSVINNLLFYLNPQDSVTVITYKNKSWNNFFGAVFTSIFAKRINFEFEDNENLYYTSKRLRQIISAKPGIIIATDSVELNMINITSLDAKVVFIIMGDFDHYYNLALLHSNIIDGFIAISDEIYNKLILLLPHRKDSIYLSYFPTPEVSIKKQATNFDNFKAIFVGRLDKSKNPLQLIAIDTVLKKDNINVDWTIVGDGFLMQELIKATKNFTNFYIKGNVSNYELHDLYAKQDLIIMTSVSEGLPVSIIEAMKTGLIPIVNDIPGGIREIVEQNVTGFLCQINNTQEFADNIKELSSNPLLYQKISKTAKTKTENKFNANKNAEHYFQLFAEIPFFPGVKKFSFYSQNRLDNKWLPNGLVKFVRSSRTLLSQWK